MKLRLLALFASTLTALAAVTAPAQANPRYAAYVIHAETGDILFDRYSTERRYPASLTKMMTLYLLFEKIEAGELTLDSKLKVSKRASLQPASRLGVTQGSTIKVDDAIKALVIKSANDVATVVAENLAGSESGFARKMTQKAREMGMRQTTFRNASGLPDSAQVTTARDLAILSQRMTQDFPQYFHYFDEDSFVWNGKTYKSHNRVAMNYKGADGLKTGYTRASGFNLATTATRGDHRLIGIVLGGRSGRTRDQHMEEILDNAFAAIEKKPTLVKSIHRVRPIPGLRPDRDEADEPAPVLLASADMDRAPESASLTPTAANALPVTGRAAAPSMTLASNDVASDLEAAPYGEGDADFAPEEAKPPRTPANRNWVVQVGAFGTQPSAIAQIHATQETVRDVWGDVGREVNIARKGEDAVYRARFTRLTETEAIASCSALKKAGSDCLILQIVQ